MRKFKIIFMTVLISVFLMAQSSPSHLNSLVASAQTLTTSWADMGSEIDLTRTGISTNWKNVCLYLDVDINGGADIQIRIFYAIVSGGERIALISTASTTLVDMKAEVFQLPDVDPDSGDINKFIRNFAIDGSVKYIQFQVKALTAGTPAAQVDLARYSLSKM